MILSRRVLLTAAVAAPIAGVSTQAFAVDAPGLDVPRVTAADHVIGDARAPVTVIEYGSLACPFSAAWQMGTYYAFKERFIDTGQVRFVVRDMLTEPADIAARATAIARCARPDRYFEVLHTLYLWQGTARNFGPMSEWYERGIAVSGKSADDIWACVAQPETMADIQRDNARGAAIGIRNTPTFFINGKRVTDGSLENLTAEITPLLGR